MSDEHFLDQGEPPLRDTTLGLGTNFFSMHLTNVFDPNKIAPPPEDHIPIEDAYSEQYALEEQRAYQRVTGSQEETPVSVSPEGLAAAADAAKRMEQLQTTREKISEDAKEPGVKDVINKVLSAMTGGVLSLDAIDKHLQAQVEGKPSELTEKLKSVPTLLKLIDVGGNTLEAVAREQATRDGLPPELVNKVAGTASLLGSILTPLGPKGKKAVTAVLQNSLYSSPISHAANMASNALTATWAIPERFLSALASAAEYGVTLGSHERRVFFGESGAMLIGALSAMVDSVRAAANVLRTGKTILPNIMQDIAGGALLPVRLLGAEDAAAKTILRSMEIYAEAYRASARTGNLSLRNIQAMVKYPSPLVEARADQFAIVNTFQRSISELGPSMAAIGKVGQGIQNVSLGAIPLGRLVVPTLRTQMNLGHFALERTPILNAFSSTLRADIAAGGVARATALGKVSGGATLAATTMYFASAGLITGGGPIDPNLRRDKIELEGWRPYSVRIGDEYYAYDRLSPLGAMLGIVADASEIGGSLKDHKMGELAQAITYAVARNITSKTFMEGAGDFLSASSGDMSAAERLKRSLISVVTPGMFRAIKRSYDPVQRETHPGADPEEGEWAELRQYVNGLKAQTPGYSHTLAPVRNLWGDAVEIPSGWGPNWLSPVYTGRRTNDPAANEIVRLGKLGLPMPGRAPRTIYGADPKKGPIDEPRSSLDVGIELTDDEYDHFVRLAGNELKDNGLGMHDAMNKMVTSDDDFKNANDPMRSVMIMRMVNGYRRAAEGELLKDEALASAFEKRRQAKAGALGATRVAVPTNIQITPR